MNMIKRMAALALVVLLALSAAACHKENEIAVTVGGVEMTSALYMCALMEADSEARQKVSESLTEAEQGTEIDYYSKQIDGTDYTDWVKNRALEVCRKFAAYELKFNELGLSLSEEDQNTIEMYVNMYWQYTYGTVYPENGVSKETYTKYFTSTYKGNAYFKSLYDEGGSKEVSGDTLKQELSGNYLIANVLNGSFTDKDGNQMDEAAQKSLRNKFEAYAARIQGGETFETIYHEYNGDEHQHSDAGENTETPQDSHATIIGADTTSYASSTLDFEAVKEMTVGDIKVVDLKDGSGIALVIRKDIMADPYYLSTMRQTLLLALKQDEFDADVEAYANTLEMNVNSFAVNRFKVKDIAYPAQ